MRYIMLMMVMTASLMAVEIDLSEVPLPSRSERAKATLAEELAEAAKEYREAVEKAKEEAIEDYQRDLNNRRTTHLEKLAIEAEIERVKGIGTVDIFGKPISEESSSLVNVDGASWLALKVGVDATMNRPGRVWVDIPSQFSGFEFVTYKVRESTGVDIKTNGSQSVYIALCNPGSIYESYLKQSGWVKSDLNLKSTSDSYQVWHKMIKSEENLNKPDGDHGIIVIRKK